MKSYHLTLLPGDGIGPEIMDAAIKVLDLVGQQFNVQFDYEEALFGGCSIDRNGVPLTDETIEQCRKSDAVVMGAVGGPIWDTQPHENKPEQGLLKLRASLGLYANLRPATIYNALLDASSLKPTVIKNADIMVVRELTGGIYFGTPRGMDKGKGWNTLSYTKEEVERIARTAFDLAQKRNNHVTSVHKANVLESSQFWREIVEEVHQDYSDVVLDEMYVDNAAMQLVRDPKQFDVILTQNLFGDILSDISAMITGSLGMLPSASLGEEYAVYEPVHGTAPEIAGQNKANPLAMIGSIAMMLDYTFGMPEAATMIYDAIGEVLEMGSRTEDIATPNTNVVSTTEMRDLVLERCEGKSKTIIEMVRMSYEG
ncbi:MAG: 3-isopropylmalate dehydrogenase [Candidatus Marinimicrobia bacterium]|jgi:3-isopropylmalate dehydrogenase|nr:3-isopropylmalate dehydrogenase [Candidatus Neomarinimicrobiota bacterium]HJL81312.1 3-isopropylmalate dehydrogenase [Gammaproteobacteria bacterium]MBT4453914.1 3-isopropylmalate dehydrogenase [Candidatus Neomarinimicrobiota bacterium]MBT5994706.1 3-isopropylmalate dehydrogenase [Candidatus Neomarinimicrobiota bacterium]MBT6391235.1 3-isopropylmalate dehydrogenase [Candidatus Neomarinimicrobiota bacterium]|tara:strand:- start:5997 stop:7106 length:1110 start_codon:yes stop_codon:yes gene_type:complete